MDKLPNNLLVVPSELLSTFAITYYCAVRIEFIRVCSRRKLVHEDAEWGAIASRQYWSHSNVFFSYIQSSRPS